MSVIAAANLTKYYGSQVGIAGLNLTVPEGQVFGFLGPNGAGKTTTIRLLLGLLRPSAGQASVLGRNCWTHSRRVKQDLGYVPGDLRLYPWMTARLALRIFGAIRGRDLRRTGAELAERFALDPEVRVRRMSKGMRQKLGLILALAAEPRLLVLDEPTTALDPLMQDELYSCLRERAAQGHTVFFSSHTLSEVEQLCDRVAILREGRLVADETLEALRGRAQRVVTLRWSGEASGTDPAPQMLRVHRKDGREWQCTLTGSTMELVHWAAQQPLEDLTIGQPNLETLFRTYYREGGAG